MKDDDLQTVYYFSYEEEPVPWWHVPLIALITLLAVVVLVVTN